MHPGAIATGIDEIRRLASAFRGEVAKSQHIAANHELDQIALVCLHGGEE